MLKKAINNQSFYENECIDYLKFGDKKYPVKITTISNSRYTLTEFEGHFLDNVPLNFDFDFKIDRVIFNDPATIVKWKDGTKTVVKCQEGDVYDPEKGLAMCIAKKALGNDRDYYDVFKKWLPEIKPMSIQDFLETIAKICTPTAEPKEEPKPQNVVEEMRDELNRYCCKNWCSECVLNNHSCKCGKGYAFKVPKEEDGYITDELIEDAYKVAFDIKEDPKEEPLYNGRVVCVDNNGNDLTYTVGKIYEFKDGKLTQDNGNVFPMLTEIKTFKDWEELSGAKWLEIKE